MVRRSTKPAIKKFEAFLGNQWQAWASGENCTISLDDDIVTMKIKSPEHGEFTTVVHLFLVPAYTIQ